MRSVLLFLAILAIGFSAQAIPLVPHSEMTPGDMCDRQDGDYSHDRSGAREKYAYCARNVETALKHEIYEAYGIPENCRKLYTIDHLIPLSMGGSNNVKNLWPEARALKDLRINLETETFEDLRDGHISQKVAIQTVLEAKLNPPEAARRIRLGGNCD